MNSLQDKKNKWIEWKWTHGDKYEKNGNDYNIINHERVNGFEVNSPDQTLQLLRMLEYTTNL